MKEQEHDLLVMKGDFPREFLESIGLVKTEIPEFSGKITGIQTDAHKAVSERLIERMQTMQSNQTSKFLSLILRHNPASVGLSLDGAGWADVGELLEALRKHGHPIDKAGLDVVVATNNKKRFEYSTDGMKIRACQGHSIKDIDLQLEPKTPPEDLYHGTAERFLVPILAGGLLPQSRQYVHLSLDVETAVKVGQRHGKPVVLQVAALQMHKDGHVFYLSHNNVWLTESVPEKYLKRVNDHK